jgi:uncharacterized protein (TIGR03382 family)
MPAVTSTLDGAMLVASSGAPFGHLMTLQAMPGSPPANQPNAGPGERPALAIDPFGSGLLAYQRFELNGVTNNYRVQRSDAVSVADGGVPPLPDAGAMDAGEGDGGVPQPPDGGGGEVDGGVPFDSVPGHFTSLFCGCQGGGLELGLGALLFLMLRRRRFTTPPAAR